MIARNSPSAVAAAKELCNRALQGEHAANLAAECERIAEVLVSDDAREGLRRLPREAGARIRRG